MEEINFYFNNFMKNWDNIKRSKIKTKYKIYKYYFDSGKGAIGPGKKLEILMAFDYTFVLSPPYGQQNIPMLRAQPLYKTKEALIDAIRYNPQLLSPKTFREIMGTETIKMSEYLMKKIIHEAGYDWALIK